MKTGLGKIDGKTLKGWVAWLRDKDCGCCHKAVGLTDLHEVDVCVGWHQFEEDGEKTIPRKIGNTVVYTRERKPVWKIAWKIGWQTFNNGMQSDFDVDFEMPWPCNEQGDVYDTVSEIGEIKSMKDWNRLAAEINRTAKEAFKVAAEIDGKAAAA